MIEKIFQPAPHPGVALFGAVLSFFGVMAYQFTSEPDFAAAQYAFVAAAVALLLTGSILLFNFFWGLRLDLSVARDGILTSARITKVAEQRGGKGFPKQWWLILYTFIDATGREQRGEVHELDSERGPTWKVGDSLKLRYHPAAPSIIRWLD